MPATAKLCQSAEMSLHFLIPPLNPPIICLISQPMHGLVSILDTFTCFLALNLIFYCTEDCSSLLILSHFRFIHPDSVPIQPKSGQIKQISPNRGYISIFFWDLPALRSSLR